MLLFPAAKSAMDALDDKDMDELAREGATCISSLCQQESNLAACFFEQSAIPILYD